MKKKSKNGKTSAVKARRKAKNMNLGETKPNKTGRPRKIINREGVAAAAMIDCTQEEIAATQGCDLDTLHNACKRDLGISFSEFYRQKRVIGNRSLRRAQWEKATEDKDSTLLIWLGKNRLNQSDKFDGNIKQSNEVVHIIKIGDKKITY